MVQNLTPRDFIFDSISFLDLVSLIVELERHKIFENCGFTQKKN
jgi:hypothetical protein